MSRRGAIGLAAAALAARALPAGAATLAAPAFAVRDDVVGALTEHVTDGHRTLLEVAREHNIGVPAISAVNPGVDPWVPGAGRRLLLPTAHVIPDAPREGIVINKADLRLYYWPRSGPVQHYAIGVGKEGFNTPSGATRIVRKRFRPTWIPTKASIDEKPWLPRVVPPGPDNPLGDYAMDLGFPGFFLLHSTNKPYGVGRRVSHGCIRLYPEGIQRLFPQVATGTRVTIVEQFVKVGWHKGELYLEVQPSHAQVDELESSHRIVTPDPAPDPRPLIVAKTGPDALRRVDWDLVAQETVQRRGIPVRITVPDADAPLADADEPAPRGEYASATAAAGMAAALVPAQAVTTPVSAPAAALAAPAAADPQGLAADRLSFHGIY